MGRLYQGFAVHATGAFMYRAGQLGGFRQLQEANPFAQDKGVRGLVSSFVAALVIVIVVVLVVIVLSFVVVFLM